MTTTSLGLKAKPCIETEPLDLDEKSYRCITLDDLRVKAAVCGCEVVVADSNTLLIDLDSDTAIATFKANLSAVQDYLSVDKIEYWNSKSGKRHVVVRLTNPLDSPVAGFLLQAALGSDLIRELLNLFDFQSGMTNTNVLFRPVGATIKVLEDNVPF